MGTKRKSKENLALDALKLDTEYVDSAPRGPSVPEEPERELGRRLARLREDRELSQEQLSQMTKAHDAGGEGISRAVISMYERGRNRPSTRELRILCDTLTVTPSELLYGDTAPFDVDRWQVLTRKGGEAKYFARWLYLLADLDSTMQLAIYQLVLGIARPTQRQIAALDVASRELLIRLAAELVEGPEKPPAKKAASALKRR